MNEYIAFIQIVEANIESASIHLTQAYSSHIYLRDTILPSLGLTESQENVLLIYIEELVFILTILIGLISKMN